MSVLRVALEEPPLATRADAWALFDDHGHRLQSGHGVPSTWPQASRREAVLAASRVRLNSLLLPPMPADRVTSAAAFALEDAFARPASEQHMHVSTRDTHGHVVATVTQHALVDALADEFSRLVAEPSLAPLPLPGHWSWLPSAAPDTFIRQPDGAAFSVSHPRDAMTLPAELGLPLTQPAANAKVPGTVDVAFAVTDAQLEAWSAATRVAFRRADPWRWDRDGAIFERLPDLRPATSTHSDSTTRSHTQQTLRWAGAIAALALVGVVTATIVQWSWLRFDSWRTGRAVVAVAADAGVTRAADIDTAANVLTRRWSDARHRAARSVPGDALPLLARASPALGALPKGALKSATFGPGQWTFELGVTDPATVAAFERQLASAGLLSLAATNPGGTRLRAKLAPGLERP
ncbi:MAG: hypothetical protein ABI777_00620 [Betaproteobacteria bacterium]